MMGIQVLVKNPTFSPTTLFSACIRPQELFSLLVFLLVICHHFKPLNQIVKSISHLDKNLAYFSKTKVTCSDLEGLDRIVKNIKFLTELYGDWAGSYLINIFQIYKYILIWKNYFRSRSISQFFFFFQTVKIIIQIDFNFSNLQNFNLNP